MHLGFSFRGRETLKPLTLIAFPVMLANIVETLYNLTDTWFLGKLGPRELAAPSVSFNFIMLIMLMGTGLSSAGTTLIARAVGRRDQGRVNFYLGQLTLLLLFFSLLTGSLGYFLSDFFLNLINTPGDMMVQTGDYLRIISLGVPFMYGFFILQATMQGVGDTAVPLRIQLFATAVNIPLDALLIFGAGPVPSMGVHGAALATVSARALACAAGFVILIRGRKGVRLQKRYLRISLGGMKNILKIGLPSAVSHMGSSLGFTVMHGMVNLYGTSVIAAFGVVNKVHAVFYMPVQGLAKGVTTMVGQSLGAENRNRAVQSVHTGIFLALIFIIPSMAFCYWGGEGLIRLFITEPDVIIQGAYIFRIISPSVVIFAIFMIYVGAFQGAGDTRSIMIMHMGRLWAIRLPIAWFLTTRARMGSEGIWYAMFLSNLMITLIGHIRFLRGKWVDALNNDKDL